MLIWVLLGHYLVNETPLIDIMAPNELGDTLAGFSGALAFFWLVLGYFQQGEELRQTRKEVRFQRKALDLQHEAMLRQHDALQQTASENERQVVALVESQRTALLSGFLNTIPSRNELLKYYSSKILISVADTDQFKAFFGSNEIDRSSVGALRELDLNLSFYQMVCAALHAFDSAVNIDLSKNFYSFQKVKRNFLINHLNSKRSNVGVDLNNIRKFRFYILKYLEEFDELLGDAVSVDVANLAANTISKSEYGILANQLREVRFDRVIVDMPDFGSEETG